MTAVRENKMLDTLRGNVDLRVLDGAHHVHSFTDPQLIANGKTRIIVRGEGCQVWDSDGRRFIDGMAGLWCVNVGYPGIDAPAADYGRAADRSSVPRAKGPVRSDHRGASGRISRATYQRCH
jgi:hypothetical protein